MSDLEKTFKTVEKATGRDLSEARKVAGCGHVEDAQLSWGNNRFVSSSGPGDRPFTEQLANVAGVDGSRSGVNLNSPDPFGTNVVPCIRADEGQRSGVDKITESAPTKNDVTGKTY